MADSLSIADARREDLPGVVALLQQMSLDQPREDVSEPLDEAYYRAFAEIEASPGQRLLVLKAGGRILGTASLTIVPNLSYRGRPHAIVDNVIVADGERGKGDGEALMRFCIDQAQATGCTRLSLTTDLRRTDAHRFYERLGFEHSHKGYRYVFE